VLPKQTGLLLPADGAEGTGFITIVILFEVAVVGLAHGELEVKIQVNTWPLFIADEVNVELFVPALMPFTCH
jgi:hypothetical protein